MDAKDVVDIIEKYWGIFFPYKHGWRCPVCGRFCSLDDFTKAERLDPDTIATIIEELRTMLPATQE